MLKSKIIQKSYCIVIFLGKEIYWDIEEIGVIFSLLPKDIGFERDDSA